MTTKALKKKYLDFFVQKDHKIIVNASLVPENNPSALFVSAGMHPLVPYLLGEPHPQGQRLCNVQRCLRTGDIEHVGDGFHHTFFEMLGNWSLDDYWKEEALAYSWEFLTKVLRVPAKRISVSCFAGDQDAPRDQQTAEIWQKLGVSPARIFFLGKKDNWWGPIGQTGPCGPDTEIFYDTGKPSCGPKCGVSCQCGKYIEIWNNVFMEYNQTAVGKYELLEQKNVDTGMGVERVTAVLSDFGDDDYRIDTFWPIVQEVAKMTGRQYKGKDQKAIRIIADHLRAAVFLINDGVLPGNVEQGYVLRRLLRRAAVKMHVLGVKAAAFGPLVDQVVQLYQDEYFESKVEIKIKATVDEEMRKFARTLDKGLRQVNKIKKFNVQTAFDLYQTYGFPFEITQELALQKGQQLVKKGFDRLLVKHQQLSRQGADKKFSGGLADHSEATTRYHTATHLLQQALRDVLGNHVQQVGSNITAERLRFDFVHPQALTVKQLRKIEAIINQKIKQDLPVKVQTMTFERAKKEGALAFFDHRHQGKVKVFCIGGYSQEICGGPHVTSTAKIGSIKITKQKAIGADRCRVYAEFA